ncbi:GspE/PulE family protein [Pseudoramibacter alactolyticus]|uniref:GspE/PulE family protein n=1 Tax=Pseudoramibacter alactolyticus TaxID=113287 RepID=UPI002355AAF6|nr:GspE/PulE family protein [Pseudoramibacter alactolyticus]MBM6968849.1 type II/IV secretion system protein [Pseudoramibacter alactolyticus]
MGKFSDKLGLHPVPATPVSDPPQSPEHIIKLSHTLLEQAVDARASDLYLEAFDKGSCRIRLRIDGVLHLWTNLSRSDFNGLLTRFKVLAQMDIADKLRPQDGSFRYALGRDTINIRVSTLPLLDGEHLVLRLFDTRRYLQSFSTLGLFPDDARKVSHLLTCRQGLIVVAGATGSGKTATVFSMLNELNQSARHILTLEDPVEIRLPGLSQVAINRKQGLDFETGLRAILRQDPDVIVIGEIRDEASALAAVRAAMTGHLVITTLHTRNIAATLDRLVNLGVPPYLIADTLIGIISQKLVRRLCPHCKTKVPDAEPLRRLWRLPQTADPHRAGRCARCRKTGHWERTGIFEVIDLSRGRKLLDAALLRGDRRAWRGHYRPFAASLAAWIARGEVSDEEARQVLF